MIYTLIPVTIAAMLGYMVWSIGFRLRKDRVTLARDRTRGKFAFRPRERIRFLLGRSFPVSEDKPEWQASLVSNLSKVTRRKKDD
jgi:hypothetical protein